MDEAIHVVAAVVRRRGRLLLAQRPPHKRHGGRWELPGGKIAAGEDAAAAVRRELAEELAVEVTAVGDELATHPDPGSPYVVHYLPVEIHGEPRAVEHTAITWAGAEDLESLPLAPSDRAFVTATAGDLVSPSTGGSG